MSKNASRTGVWQPLAQAGWRGSRLRVSSRSGWSVSQGRRFLCHGEQGSSPSSARAGDSWRGGTTTWQPGLSHTAAGFVLQGITQGLCGTRPNSWVKTAVLVPLWPFLTAKDHINSRTGLDTSSSSPLPKRWGKAAQQWCCPAPFPCSSQTWQAPGAGNIHLGQEATPMQHSKTRAVIHRGNHFPWDRGNGSHFLLFTYPIFKVPILTTSITQLAQQQLGCCSL